MRTDEVAVNASNAGTGGPIVVAGAGYARLHVALRLTARLLNNREIELVVVDRHDYHQVLTELPRVAGGTRTADAVRIPLQDMLAERVRFIQTEITGFDLAGQRLLSWAGPIGWGRLVLALGSRPNDFAIPGRGQRALSVYSISDAERVWAAVSNALDAAAVAANAEEQRRLATVVVGGGGATGVELAGELAEMLPEVACGHGLAADRPAVLLVEAGPTILAGSSPPLIDKATGILADLGVQIRTGAVVADATEQGFRLKDGELVEGGVFVWAGGVKAPDVVVNSGLPTGHNGRVKVDQYLRVLDRPDIGRWRRWRRKRARRWPATCTRSCRAGRWRRSPSMTRGSSSRSGPAAGSPTLPASPPAGGWPTCSRTPSSGSTANPSGTCAAGTRWPSSGSRERPERKTWAHDAHRLAP
jgi:NADH:ubiquinone reductase (H+-translocating)